MRRIKDIPISMGRLKQGNWYKVHIEGDNVNKNWFIRFHSIDDTLFHHYKSAYVVSNEYDVQTYPCPCLSGDNHPLCYVNEIDRIELVSVEYVCDMVGDLIDID